MHLASAAQDLLASWWLPSFWLCSITLWQLSHCGSPSAWAAAAAFPVLVSHAVILDTDDASRPKSVPISLAAARCGMPCCCLLACTCSVKSAEKQQVALQSGALQAQVEGCAPPLSHNGIAAGDPPSLSTLLCRHQQPQLLLPDAYKQAGLLLSTECHIGRIFLDLILLSRSYAVS